MPTCWNRWREAVESQRDRGDVEAERNGTGIKSSVRPRVNSEGIRSAAAKPMPPIRAGTCCKCAGDGRDAWMLVVRKLTSSSAGPSAFWAPGSVAHRRAAGKKIVWPSHAGGPTCSLGRWYSPQTAKADVTYQCRLTGPSCKIPNSSGREW